MAIYRAKSSFQLPNTPNCDELSNSSVLSFNRGEVFEILEDYAYTLGKSWWGVRQLKDDSVGFVPASFLKKAEDEDTLMYVEITESVREAHRRTLEELKSKPSFKHPDLLPDMIPEADYSDSDEQTSPRLQSKASSNGSILSEDRLILPKKVSNPNMDSKDKMNIHKELLFNKKMGKSVLGQKSELKKVMDKFQDDQKKKELENERLSKRTSLEKKLEEQANKLKMMEMSDIKEDESVHQSEFHRIHAKLRPKIES